MRKVATFVAIVMLTHTPPISAASAEQSLKDKIVGTWKIISWESQRSNGPVLNIWMGLHPNGLIIYQPNGYMAVQVMAATADVRPKSGNNSAPVWRVQECLLWLLCVLGHVHDQRRRKRRCT
jgi:hypothetical protein